MNELNIRVNEAEFRQGLDLLKKASKSLNKKWTLSLLRRKARPIVNDMKTSSPSNRIAKMISITTSKKYTKGAGIRLGVVHNNKAMFPKFSAQALASVLEYGTVERFRRLKKLGIITGRISTGRVTSAPYLRPAWHGGRERMISETVKEIKKKIPL